MDDGALMSSVSGQGGPVGSTPGAGEDTPSCPPRDAAPRGGVGDGDQCTEPDREPAAEQDREPFEEPADDGFTETAGGRRGWRVAAVAGLVLLAGATAAACVLAVAVVTHGFRQPAPVRYQPGAVFGVRPGECVDDGANPVDVRVVSCGRPHDAEVFATFRLAGRSWPGDAGARRSAAAGCAARLHGYVRPQLADVLTQVYIFPDQRAWQAGVRTVVCEVRADTGRLTGSVRR